MAASDASPEAAGLAAEPALSHLVPPTPGLEFLCRIEVDLLPPMEMGAGHAGGIRRCVMFSGGRFYGPKMNGTIDSGGDWMSVHPTKQTAYLDTRYNLKTDDGVWIYVRTRGVRHAEPEILKHLLDPNATVNPSDYYFRINVQFETGDPKYAFLNEAIFVGSAIRTGKIVIYDCYKVT